MPAGRPPKYKTPEEMQEVIDAYFLACKVNNLDDPEAYLEKLPDHQQEAIKDIDDRRPTICGLAYVLDMSRQALCDYEKKDQFLDTIKKAKLRIEKHLEQRLDGNAAVGTIFNLKNNFGWKDSQDINMNHTVTLKIRDFSGSGD